jgi:Xaa-Pro aminopeptidase
MAAQAATARISVRVGADCRENIRDRGPVVGVGPLKHGDAVSIRIENLVLLIAAPEPVGAEKPLNAFETLTLAPIDRRLIETRMLTTKERVWLDSYHARVHEVIGPLVDKPTRAWLTASTRSLSS